MPQALLPLIPDGATQVNDRISVVQQQGQWTYFCGIHPVFEHGEEDRASFRMFSAQLVCQGSCRQSEIIQTFGVSKNSVKRSVKKYRDEGIESFFRPRRPRSSNVLTPQVVARAQELLYRGGSPSEVADELEIKRDTLRKAINQGRIQGPPRQRHPAAEAEASAPVASGSASDKSQRSLEDAAAPMGIACTRPLERVAAALGLLDGAPTEFQVCRDVSFGGVLCALPALTQNGLFDHLDECFPSLGGYYTTTQIVSLLALMALCRIQTVEQLQYQSPGELGKLLGLDRVPEVRCLRQKLTRLSQNNAPEQWAGRLSRDWLQTSEEWAGTLYVDGHVRLYHGHQTPLPRRYVARQRLCLRGTTGYWVNDALGQPTPEQLATDPYRHRFIMVFDREGYSPKFFKQMWREHRIACLSYHKYPKGDWPEPWFQPTDVTLPSGEQVSLKLAELSSWVGDRQSGLFVREVRKLTESGHQTSLISTAYGHLALQDAAGLFSRWAQENFFRYMIQHYAIDLLSEYRTEEIPGTNRPVVNPPWRELERQSRSLKGRLTHRQARFAALTLHPQDDQRKLAQWQRRKAVLREEIEHLEQELQELRGKIKQTPKHIEWQEMPEEQKFQRLAPSRKQLMDTVRLIAYRAETALVSVVREKLARGDDARSLLRDLFRTEADLCPDANAGVLTVHVHSMANPRSNRAIHHLLTQLNAAELTYPGTNFKLVYTLARGPDH